MGVRVKDLAFKAASAVTRLGGGGVAAATIHNDYLVRQGLGFRVQGLGFRV